MCVRVCAGIYLLYCTIHARRRRRRGEYVAFNEQVY